MDFTDETMKASTFLSVVYDSKDQAELAFRISLVIIISLATFFLIPLSFLFVVQTQNFLYN